MAGHERDVLAYGQRTCIASFENGEANQERSGCLRPARRLPRTRRGELRA